VAQALLLSLKQFIATCWPSRHHSLHGQGRAMAGHSPGHHQHRHLYSSLLAARRALPCSEFACVKPCSSLVYNLVDGRQPVVNHIRQSSALFFLWWTLTVNQNLHSSLQSAC
jgi:hypothetical protein